MCNDTKVLETRVLEYFFFSCQICGGAILLIQFYNNTHWTCLGAKASTQNIQRRKRPEDHNLSITIIILFLTQINLIDNTSLAEIRVIDLLIVAARREMKQVR